MQDNKFVKLLSWKIGKLLSEVFKKGTMLSGKLQETNFGKLQVEIWEHCKITKCMIETCKFQDAKMQVAK